MNTNIILSGVGGQGILTVAAIIDHAAMLGNLFIKQAEVHGMSQRGGAVQSHLRISDSEIYSDLIALGGANLIMSLEPMEALRYIPYLSDDGLIITAIKPIKNIVNYPDEEKVIESITNSKFKHIFVDVEKLSKQAGNAKMGNVVMVGAAYKYLGLDKELFYTSIKEIFAKKGSNIIEQNLHAFELGAEISLNI